MINYKCLWMINNKYKRFGGCQDSKRRPPKKLTETHFCIKPKNVVVDVKFLKTNSYSIFDLLIVGHS